jgi:hypothetical protein
MEYHYVACDGPDCDQKLNLQSEEHSRQFAEKWIAVSSAGGSSHACSQECLVAFVNEDPDEHADRIAKQFAETLGVELIAPKH